MQTVFDNPTLEDRIMNLSRELATAKDELAGAISRYSLYKNAQAVLHGRIDLASATIKEAIIQDDIDKDTLIQIASDLQVELTREVSIKMTITARGTATVPIDFDLDDMDNEIGIEFNNNYGAAIEFDTEVDDMIVDCEDI